MPLNAMLESLGHVIHDITIEEKGIQPVLYWDASNVGDALLGQAHYYDHEFANGRQTDRFVQARFEDDRSLIYALASNGRFGTIRLFPPHQSELLSLINREFRIGSKSIPYGGVPRLLKDADLAGLTDSELSNPDRLEPQRIREIVAMQVGQSPKLFKLIEAVRYANWKSRLAAWVDGSVLQIDKSPYDYHDIVGGELFLRVSDELDRRRPDKRRNNFSDAVALCQLAERIRHFATDTSVGVPRFYATPFYYSVIENTGLKSAFEYSYEDKAHTVFRDINYFKIRATLEHVGSGKPEGSGAPFYSPLNQVREDLRTFGTSSEAMDESLRRLASNRDSIGKALDAVQQYAFLEKVWLRENAEKAIAGAISEYIERTKRLRDLSPFRDEMQSRVIGIEQELRAATDQFTRMSSLWNEMQTQVAELRWRADERRLPDEMPDLNVLSGMLRFGFPAEEQRKIEALLGQVMSEEFDQRNKAMIETFRNIPDGVTKDQNRGIAIPAAIMWALKMHTQLSSMLEKNRPLHHSSLRLLEAAALLELKRPIDALPLINRLQSEFDNTSDEPTKAHLAMGLTYLVFHYAGQMKGLGLIKDKEHAGQVKQATEYAKKGMYFLASDLKRGVYALNQVLYCMSIAKDPSSSDEAAEVFSKLQSFENNPGVWQYRYDDTLAAYFEWLVENDSDHRRDLLNSAYDRANRARNASRGSDREVSNRAERLLAQLNRVTKAG